jgi:hypothetical protein
MSVRILKAVTAFFIGNQFIPAGSIVLSNDPLVQGREALFVDVMEGLGVDYEVVERATAAPGEKRATPRRKKAEN